MKSPTTEKPVEKPVLEQPDKTPVEFVASPTHVGYLDGYREGYEDASWNFTKWMLVWVFILLMVRLISISTRDE